MNQHQASADGRGSIGVSVGKGLRGVGYFEPRLSHRFLPRCGGCGAKHPLAHNPPLDAALCPDCGAPASPVASAVEIPAILAGRSPAAIAARACLGAGKLLTKLWRRL